MWEKCILLEAQLVHILIIGYEVAENGDRERFYSKLGETAASIMQLNLIAL